ncbi:MAG TPA: ArsA-related P-loop ATPase [Acidimicrobiia bacterium]|nr:ArsA-related P-loop ATPase [Acidimicrobiia bacterium]
MTFADIVDERHVVVCCGTGGVGKTTTAATLAIEGARRGRDAVVVTIDPAKRLANTLGLEHLSNTPHEIPRSLWRSPDDPAVHGRLHALMLDTKSTFDQLVGVYAADAEQAERILTNSFYRNIAGALSGTQEYMAMEKLYELHAAGTFELIVIDTPPTRHALDFLDAPRRLTRLLDNRIFRLLMVPTRTTFRVTSAAASAFVRTVARVVGREPVDDIIAFFRAFDGMEAGFRDRANQVMALLGAPTTAFVLVTTPRRDTVEEGEYFAERLTEHDMRVEGLIVNRVHAHYCDRTPDELRARADEIAAARGADPAAAARLAARFANLADLEQVAARERQELAGLEDRLGDAAVAHVPELDHDVYDFGALRAVGRYLVK